MTEKRIRAKISGRDGGAAYISLPGHRPEPGIVKKTVELEDLMPNYEGPRVMLDFDTNGVLIGIEILVFDSDLPE